MIDRIDQISSKQLMSFIISSQIGLGILSLPAILAEKVGHDGWITILLSGIVAVLLIIPMIKLSKKFPDSSILDINVILYGKILGMLLNYIFISYLIFTTGLSSRIFVELINIIVLKETPAVVIGLIILLPTYYFTLKGLKVICRFANLLYLAYGLMLVTFLFIIKEARITYLLPVAKPGFPELVKSIPYTTYSFLGFELTSVFFANVTNKQHTMRHIIYGVIFVTIFFTIVTIFSTLLFGETKLKLLVFPIFNIEQAIRMPIIERLDLFFIIFWFPTMAASARTYFFSSFYCTSKAFGITHKKLLIAAISGLMLIISRLPINFESLYSYMNFSAAFGMVNIAVILLSFLISCTRKEAGCR